MPHYPELLMAGREREFWSFFAPQFDHKLSIPVLAVGGEVFFGDEVRHQMEMVAQHVRSVVTERCGDNPSLERPDELARDYLEFYGEKVAA